MLEFGARIKSIRESKGLKARFIAEKAGLSPAVYSGIENGRSKLTADNAKKIADAMGIDIREIFF